MQIISPRSYVSASTSSEFELVLDKLFFKTNGNITVEIESSTVNNFGSGLSTVTPAKIIIDKSVPETVITNGTVPYQHNNKKIKIRHTWTKAEKVYIRIKVTQDSKSYYSNAIMLSTQGGNGQIVSKAAIKSFRPEYISFHDIYEMSPSGVTLKVEVSNNALDTTPTWENATTSYTNHTPYMFTNRNKTNANYAVSVRITVTKSSASGYFNLYKMQFIVT